MQSFAITCLVTVIWVIAGYSLLSLPAVGTFGSLDRLFLDGMVFQKEAGKVTGEPSGVVHPGVGVHDFQMTFAIITPALICGAFADRMKFSAMLWFMGLWSLLVYSPIAHMVWDGDRRLLGRQWACSTSPAARWCTSTPVSRPWCAR